MFKKSQVIIPLFMLAFLLGSTGSNAQNSLFFVFLSSNPDRAELRADDDDALYEDHLESIDRLYKEGKLLLTGNFNDDDGVFVIKAGSMNKVQDLLSSDPAINANRLLTKALPMQIEKGWICEQVKPYEMIKLNFIHYTTEEGNSQATTNPGHKNFIQKNDVLFAFSMKNEAGLIEYVVILKESADAGRFANNDPLVTSGNFSYKIKTWQVSNQVFCSEMSKKIN